MKRVQTILIKVLMLGLMVQGALLLLHLYGVEPIRGAIEGFIASIPQEAGAEEEKKLLGLIAGWVMVALGLIGVAPLPNWRRNRAVTFRSGHGNITIQMDSVYRTMHKIVNRMPEVRSCRLDIQPSPDGTVVCIKADARLYKLPRQRARATAMRVSDIIADAAMNFLGLEDLVSLDLNIQDFTVDIEESCKALLEEHGTQKRALTPDFEAAIAAAAESLDVDRGDARLEAFEEPAAEPMPDTPQAAEWDEEAAEEGALGAVHDAQPEPRPLADDVPRDDAIQEPATAWLPAEEAGVLPPLEAETGVFDDVEEQSEDMEDTGAALPPLATPEESPDAGEAPEDDSGTEPHRDKDYWTA